MQKKKVTTIPATLTRFTSQPLDAPQKRRTAAYARVSTDNEEQATSYEAQVDYYTRYIKSRADWSFVGIYTDDGISGTDTKHREGFKKMISDAMDGKIDLIVTKSVSRFARNTVDSLTTVRQLKEKGIEIFFEKENIWTLDSKGELLITIMSSLAQEESRSISENTTWGHRKRFADGKLIMPFASFLGYRRGDDGTPVIVEEEAELVRWIYNECLLGTSLNGIGKKLNAKGILTKRGCKWTPNTIKSILTNEKYTGNALLQKTYTADFLTKTIKKNEGEVPQYYVEKSHPAIVSEELFNLVQEHIATHCYKFTADRVFSQKVYCGECGGVFGPKLWHSNDAYRKMVWQCNDKYGKGTNCSTGHLSEEQLQEAFIKAFNKKLKERKEIGEALDIAKKAMFDVSGLRSQLEENNAEIDRLAIQIERMVHDNATMVQDQDIYEKKQEELFTRYEAAQEQSKELESEIKTKSAKAEAYDRFVESISNHDTVLEKFDEFLFLSLVEKMIVYSPEKIKVVFKDGSSI